MWRGRLQTAPRRDAMPYNSVSDLPDSVRDNLPKHAQEIYQAAFNSAWDEYKGPDDRRGDDSREETAHQVAWAAVKQKYEKRDGQWVSKNS
jgi:cation transport regulator